MRHLEQVRDYHGLVDSPVREEPGWPAEQQLGHVDNDRVRVAHEHLVRARDTLRESGHPELFRAAFAVEEVAEYVGAVRDRDLVAVADGLADAVYVLLGTALTYGIPFDAVWDEVHRSNMEKVPDPAGGKALKPPGWRGPDVEGALRG